MDEPVEMVPDDGSSQIPSETESSKATCNNAFALGSKMVVEVDQNYWQWNDLTHVFNGVTLNNGNLNLWERTQAKYEYGHRDYSRRAIPQYLTGILEDVVILG
jgi:hypothetical protein